MIKDKVVNKDKKEKSNTNNDVNNLVKMIKESIETKKITKEVSDFIISWLDGKEVTKFHRDVFYQLAIEDVLPFDGSNCFRGCKKVLNSCAESYSTSIETATRFAGEDGFIIAVDNWRNRLFTFALNEYLALIFEETEPNIYPPELMDKIEEMIAEEEIIVVTDISCSSLFKVVNLNPSLQYKSK